VNPDFGLLYPDGDPDRHQNVISWSLGHTPALHKISSKSVGNFFYNPVNADFGLLDPDGDPDLSPKFNHLVPGHALPLQEISSKSVHNFFSYPTDRQTDKQTDKQTEQKTYPPSAEVTTITSIMTITRRDMLQHWAAISVRHCPQPSSVLHWTSLPSRPLAGSSLSSPGLHFGPTWQLETEDWMSKAILVQNRGGRPANYESWTGDCEATRSRPIGSETRGNGYVFSDTLLKRERQQWLLLLWLLLLIRALYFTLL